MSFFKKKSKAKKGAEKDDKPADNEPKPQPYKHIPRHAAADSISNGSSDRRGDKEQIAAANLMRSANQKNDYNMRKASYSQSLAHNAMHGTPSPSSVAGQQMSWNRYNSTQRNDSIEVFTTDPDAPPMPPASTASTPGSRTQNFSQRSDMPRNNSGYFPTMKGPPSFDSPIMGNPKMAAAARDRGYHVNPHFSADSGYGSTAQSTDDHSRESSEHNYLPEPPAVQSFRRSESGFLPELSLSEELAREPAFSEHSFDDSTETPTPKKPRGSALKSTKSNASQYEHDVQSFKSSKSGSKAKQTRFEEAADPAWTQAQYQAGPGTQVTYEQATPQIFRSEAQRDARPESATIPQPQLDFNLPEPVSRAPQAAPKPSAPARMSIPSTLRESEKEAQPVSPIIYAAPQPQPQFAPLERIVSAGSYRPAVPLASVLEGHKVNKKGKILDEEGDVIGELYEGDIIDCVRQRVNAYGEVIDDHGNVVGRVRTLQKSMESPILRSATPDMHQSVHQDFQQYQQPVVQQSQPKPVAPQRSASTNSQPQVFTPAWQQTRVPQQEPVLAQELMKHLAAEPQVAQLTVVSPFDHSENVTAVELDASEPVEEVLPIFDHSEVFMPPPFIPARSPLRTPSPPSTEKHPNLQDSSAGDNALLTSEGTPRSRKHVSAPPPQRQWAAAALIQQYESEPVAGPQALPEARTPAPRPLLRSASDSGTSETPRSFSRPSMMSVPEDNVVAAEQPIESAAYSYKGDIPAADGPPPNARLAPPRAIGANTHQMPPFPRPNFNGGMPGGMPGGGPFPPVNSAQFTSAGGLSPRRAQFATGIPGVRPQLNPRTSLNAPLRRSPLSHHETTPPESDAGSDDGKQGPSHSRAPSVRTMASVRTTASTMSGKPRTYFTHSGKIRVDGTQPTARQTAAEQKQAKPDTASVSEMSISGKKKSRFSIGFGKKNQAAAVAAH